MMKLIHPGQTMRIISLLLLMMLVTPVKAVMDAQSLYGHKQHLVYQIRVIDIGSGDKSSIGSGFLISDEGYIATNFHVISSYVHEPEKFRLEYVDSQNRVADISLVAIDVVHDLAILKTRVEVGDFLLMQDAKLVQGERLFSMGNPHDLGMTIIEGTNNGLVKKSRYKKILFSGSLNPGMSGGPVMNQFGEVVGVNVSKSGEQLSFLVPVIYLKQLLEVVLNTKEPKPFEEAISEALQQDQEAFYQALIAQPFSQISFGGLLVPGNVSALLNCWGHTLNEKDIKYRSFHQHCRLEDDIYIRDDFSTGVFYFDYEWLDSGELNPMQFASAIQYRYQISSLDNAEKEEYVSNYRCHTDFIEVAGSAWKVSSCMRKFKEYEGLYDAVMVMALIDNHKSSAIIRVGASGISMQNAVNLFGKFMRSLQWQP